MEINRFMVMRRALKLLWNYDMNSFGQFDVFRGKIDVNARHWAQPGLKPERSCDKLTYDYMARPKRCFGKPNIDIDPGKMWKLNKYSAGSIWVGR